MRDLTNKFVDIYGAGGDIRTFHAPGRVNIIGEHIDYNGGFVLPYALDMGTTAIVRKTDGTTARFASTNFDARIEASLDNIVYDKKHDWANYPMGVLALMLADGHALSGFDVLFSGNIPNGAGLSSSASVEMVMAAALNSLFNLGYDMIDLVQLAQRAENQFCGVNCGIMDQFAVGMARRDNALHLNCGSLKYAHVPMRLGNFIFIILDTNKRRKLNESKYNERRTECEQALAILAQTGHTGQLAEMTPEYFAAHSHLLDDKTIYARARHVVSENHRVSLAAQALTTGDMPALGALLTTSHASLRDDYEVSCHELDTIVNLSNQHPACLGARMTGAGFGGCAIALVRQDAAADFMADVAAKYEHEIGYAPALYVCKSGDGAREI